MQICKLIGRSERVKEKTINNSKYKYRINLCASHKGQCILHSSHQFSFRTWMLHCTAPVHVLSSSIAWLNSASHFTVAKIIIMIAFIRFNSEFNWTSFIFTTWIAHLVSRFVVLSFILAYLLACIHQSASIRSSKHNRCLAPYNCRTAAV